MKIPTQKAEHIYVNVQSCPYNEKKGLSFAVITILLACTRNIQQRFHVHVSLSNVSL